MMNYPIQIEELLERVSGNREFVILMLEKFFQTGEERVSALHKAFDRRNYKELAHQVHTLKGVVSNLSINKALGILKELHEAAAAKNDLLIARLLCELEETIAEAKTFYQENPSLKQ